MAASRFLDAMRDRPLLLDGGMGVRLIVAGFLDESEDSSRANLDAAEAVLAIHRDDVRAGSDALVTNTISADRRSLASDWRTDEFEAINRAAVSLAREAAGPDRFVLGSIGPIRFGSPTEYREHATILIESGVDALLLETHTSITAEAGLRALSSGSPVPILASLHAWPIDAAGAAKRLVDLGAVAVGTNCGRSTDHVLACLEQLAGRIDVPLLAKPSAGPDEGPEVFAALVPQFLAMGVRLIGGCCGATAQHVAAMRRALDLASA